jgi:hypothetical protein
MPRLQTEGAPYLVRWAYTKRQRYGRKERVVQLLRFRWWERGVGVPKLGPETVLSWRRPLGVSLSNPTVSESGYDRILSHPFQICIQQPPWRLLHSPSHWQWHEVRHIDTNIHWANMKQDILLCVNFLRIFVLNSVSYDIYHMRTSDIIPPPFGDWSPSSSGSW